MDTYIQDSINCRSIEVPLTMTNILKVDKNINIPF